MSKWIDFTADERRMMIQHIADTHQIDEAAAEKDWWVTAALYAIFHTSISDYLLFKGGTSLSKGWNMISRFSEDIDLALNRDFFLNVKGLSCANCANNTQIHNFRERGQDYLLGEFKKELEEKLRELGLPVRVMSDNDLRKERGAVNMIAHDKDPSVLYLQYPSLYVNARAYAVPTVKMEISVLSMSEPYEMREVKSLVGQIFEGMDDELVQIIKTVSPSRTFLEKAFLLCEELQKDKPRTRRMTRHFYDLEKLMQTPYADAALHDGRLYADIVKHRRRFYHVGYVDYDKELPENIVFCPPNELLPRYAEDYEEMKKSFIYGEALPFDELMTKMQALQNRFREIELEG